MTRWRRIRFSLLACVLAVVSTGCSSCGRTDDPEDLGNKQETTDPPPNSRMRRLPQGMQAQPLTLKQVKLAPLDGEVQTASPIRPPAP